MSVSLIILLVLGGGVLLLYFSSLSYVAQADKNPVVWRAQMLIKIRKDTLKYVQRHRISVSAAHSMAIQDWYNTILNSGNPTMYRLYNEMMQDEFPKQLEMIGKIVHGDSYKSGYANIKNKEEMLEIVNSERATLGGISNLEKMFIDRVILALPSMETADEINKNIPHILLGTEEMGLPVTFEEISSYLKEKLRIK